MSSDANLVIKSFPTSGLGYRQLLAFVHTFGTVPRIGVEGTASYGTGITAYLRDQHILVREVIRPNRQARRKGKSDPIDAYAAARAVAVDEDLPIPKLLGGQVDLIRVNLKTRATAVKARTAAITQIKNFLITAPRPTTRSPCQSLHRPLDRHTGSSPNNT